MNINSRAFVVLLFATISLGCASSSSVVARAEASSSTAALENSADWANAIQEIGTHLKNDGVIGLVHGADSERGLYVFEYNDPKDFFKRYYFSLLAKDHSTLSSLNRGDRIKVWGNLGGEETPQPHLIAKKIEMIEAYLPNVATPGGHDARQADLPKELKNISEMTVQVHAVVADGQVLVVEYKDAIVPVVVSLEDSAQTKDLFRGDVIRIGFELQKHPHQPTHVAYVPRAQSPYFDVIERLVNRHGQPTKLTGALVLFPKSPVINQDIWAVEESLGYGLFRYSTLVNFEPDANGQMTEWANLKAKLRAAWDAHPEGVTKGRNKFINRKVQIQVSGIANVVSPSQANAQLFLKASDATVLP